MSPQPHVIPELPLGPTGTASAGSATNQPLSTQDGELRASGEWQDGRRIRNCCLTHKAGLPSQRLKARDRPESVILAF